MEHETLISIAILVSNLEIKSCKFIFLPLFISLSLAVAVLLLAIFPRNHSLAFVTILDNLFLSLSLPGLSHPVAQQLPFVVVGRCPYGVEIF